MIFSLSIIYIIYLIFVAIALLFTFFIAYHMIRFGLLTVINIFLLIFFLGITAGILFISWEFMSQIDWQQIVQLNFINTSTNFF
ncbi:MAG: hypothetical protein WCX71_02265 [Candidatus Buchananbacteria bacterium]